jgi:hypothetical protein
MFLSTLFSHAQKAEYEIIYSDAEFFEFNSARDKIYIYAHHKLSVYDIKKAKLSVLDTDIYAETLWLRFPFFLAKTGLIYFVISNYVYEITDENTIKKIPVVYKEYSGGMMDKEYMENRKHEMDELNKLLADCEDNHIQNLHNDIFIVNYQDGHSIAFHKKRLEDKKLTKENKEKVLKHSKLIDLDIDTSYAGVSTDIGVTNYFDNKKLLIKEESYSCRRTSFMSLVSGCKYKIDIEFNNKTVKFKDTKRRTRLSYVAENTMSVDLNKYLPNSRYITDKNGDIYILFWIKDEHNLIKLPINQFN